MSPLEADEASASQKAGLQSPLETLKLLEEKKHLISVFGRSDTNFDVAVLRAMMTYFKLADERQQRAELRK